MRLNYWKFFEALMAFGVVVAATSGAAASDPRPRGSELFSSARPQASEYEKAFKLLKGGKAAEALRDISKALAKDPTNAGLYNLRGLAESQLGRKEDAERSFRKVIELAPKSALGYLNLGVLLSELNRSPEAVDSFRAALKRDPHNFTTLLGLGAALTSLGRYGDAETYLQEAWIRNPENFQTGYEYARTLRELKRPAEAQKVLARLRPPDDAPRAAKFFTLAGVLAEDQNDAAAAVRNYSMAYKLSPDSFDVYASLLRASLKERAQLKGIHLPQPPPNLAPEQHFALGLLFASRGAYGLAIPHFEKTLQTEPESYSAGFNLALSYKGAGRSLEAIDLCERIAKRNPTGELHNLLASLEEETGRYVEAARDYRRAVELDPTSEQYYFDLGAEYLTHFTFGPALEVFEVGSRRFPTAVRQYLGLGLAHYGLRHYLEAAEAIFLALETDPASPQAHAAWNSLVPSLSPEEWEKFLPRLRRLWELHPTSAEALYAYASLLFRYDLATGRLDGFDLVRSLLQQALSLNPNLADAHLELGNLYSAQTEYEKAAAEYRKAIRLDPNSAMTHYRLGQAYRNLNKLKLAAQELARYSELARGRREQLARSQRTIKEFILAEPRTLH